MLTASDMNALGQDPNSADVTAAQSTTSTSYGDLTTAGPSVTMNLTTGQKVMVSVSAEIWGAGSGVEVGRMSFAVSGATTVTANDNNGASNRLTSNVITMCSRTSIITATATGSHTFTAKYKTTSSGTTANFENRRIVVFPKF